MSGQPQEPMHQWIEIPTPRGADFPVRTFHMRDARDRRLAIPPRGQGADVFTAIQDFAAGVRPRTVVPVSIARVSAGAAAGMRAPEPTAPCLGVVAPAARLAAPAAASTPRWYARTPAPRRCP
jgi:hypothetical protein